MTAFTPPEFGAPLAPAHASAETVELLRLRRSTAADLLTEPGPDRDALQTILSIAARAPDHRRVAPFRFIIFEGEGREKAGDILAAAYERNEPKASPSRIAGERGRFLRAPVVVAVVSAVNRDHKTPEWEQVLTAGAVCENLLIAANAHGFAAQWLTEWYAYDADVIDAFGLTGAERIAGYVYLGSAKENPLERQRPVLADHISWFS